MDYNQFTKDFSMNSLVFRLSVSEGMFACFRRLLPFVAGSGEVLTGRVRLAAPVERSHRGSQESREVHAEHQLFDHQALDDDAECVRASRVLGKESLEGRHVRNVNVQRQAQRSAASWRRG